MTIISDNSEEEKNEGTSILSDNSDVCFWLIRFFFFKQGVLYVNEAHMLCKKTFKLFCNYGKRLRFKIYICPLV